MGSFDVACGISNLAIHMENRVGFLFIQDSLAVKNLRARRIIPEGGGVHFDNEFSAYKPYLPPVFGTYNDYGHIIDVTPSPTTKFIEEMFNKPIEVVIKCVGSDRDIYSEHGEIYQNYFVGDKDFQKFGSDVKSGLVSLGFDHSTTDDGKEVFSYQGYEIVCDDANGSHFEGDQLIRSEKTGRVIVKGIHARDTTKLLSVFGHYTRIYPGFSPEDFDAIRKLNRMSGMYFLEEVYEALRESDVVEYFLKSRLAKMKEDWPNFIAYLNDPSMAEEHKYMSGIDYQFKVGMFLERDISFEREDFILLKTFTDADEFFQMREITNIMDALNRVVMPTYCGTQHGNDEASLVLANVSKSILDKRIAEYDDEYGEDDEGNYEI